MYDTADAPKQTREVNLLDLQIEIHKLAALAETEACELADSLAGNLPKDARSAEQPVTAIDRAKSTIRTLHGVNSELARLRSALGIPHAPRPSLVGGRG